MKIRLGMVSNSSSSSFWITDLDHPGVKWLIENEEYYDYYVEGRQVYDAEDNGVWSALHIEDFDWEEFLSQESFNG